MLMSTRRHLKEDIYADLKAKRNAIIDKVATLVMLRVPVMVATQSIKEAQELSEFFHEGGIEHNVLTGKDLREQAKK